MSRTDEYINELYEAGLVDRFGNRLYPNLSGAGDRQPTQGANGTRINPSDVLGNERFIERRTKMNEQPVALWYKGVTYHNSPGQKHLYREVSRDGDDNWKTAPVEDGSKVQRWLTNNGYRIVYQKKMCGSGWRWDFTQCWMHERYAGSGEEPGDFHPESLAQLREYIALAVAKRDEPEEDAVAPELPEQEATVQPEPEEDTSVIDKIAAWIGVYLDAKQAGWIA